MADDTGNVNIVRFEHHGAPMEVHDEDADEPGLRLYIATLHIAAGSADEAVELAAEVDDVLAAHFGSMIHVVRESLAVSIHGSPFPDHTHADDGPQGEADEHHAVTS